AAAPAWEIALAALPPDPKRQGTAALQDAGARGEAFGVRQSSGAFAGPPPPHPASSVQHQVSSIQHPPSAPRLALRGRIDRVDLFRNAAADEALCVVVDYKSSHKQLDAVLMAHGVQLQLPAYLAVLRHWP